MTATQKVRQTQRLLRLMIAGSTVFWTTAVFFGGLSVTIALSALVTLSQPGRLTLQILVVAAGLATFGVLAWRGRFAWSFDRVALWIEERNPDLRYVLVTAVDPRYRETVGPVLDQVVAHTEVMPFVRRAALRTTLPAFVALLLTLAAFMVFPRTWTERMDTGTMFRSGAAAVAVVGNRLVPLNGELESPVYAHLAITELDEPSTITGLQGSRVTLKGVGAPAGIHVTLGGTDIRVIAGERGWMSSFIMSDSTPTALKLIDRQYSRLVVIDPRVDQPPAARLLLPLRDTTLRIVDGVLHLAADFTDDVGLASAHFEYIVSNTGEGDQSAARVGILGKQTLGSQNGSYSIDVPYVSLKLAEGDLLSVRAVVLDNNTLYGPGKGYSETRSIRIARKGEYDSLAVNAAPASADTAMMTLRMLIIATEGLDKLRPTMARRPFADSAQRLGSKADIVRQKIQRIMDAQTGGGQIDPNPLLTQALDAMWQATRSLAIAETGEAIPQMWIAYRALEQLRSEKRYYLRGRTPPVVVNIERVRLTGKDTGTAQPIAVARGTVDTDRERLRDQYAIAVATLGAHPGRAFDLLTMLRVATLRDRPRIAAALGDAITALRRGTDATSPLLRVRRALDAPGATTDSLPLWSGAW